MEDFNKAIELRPKFATYYNNRGVLKNQLNKYEEALEDFNTAIKLNPQIANFYYNRGTAKLGLKKKIRARKDFDKAIELNPSTSNQGMINIYYGIPHRYKKSEE